MIMVSDFEKDLMLPVRRLVVQVCQVETVVS